MKLCNVAKRRLELAQVAKSLAKPLEAPAFNREAGASSIFHVLAAQCLCVPFIIHVEISSPDRCFF